MHLLPDPDRSAPGAEEGMAEYARDCLGNALYVYLCNLLTSFLLSHRLHSPRVCEAADYAMSLMMKKVNKLNLSRERKREK